MAHYVDNCGPMVCYVIHTLLHAKVPSFDNQLDIKGIVGQEVNTVDQLQLLHYHGMIQPLFQSRWYLLHRDKYVELPHLILVTTLGGQLHCLLLATTGALVGLSVVCLVFLIFGLTIIFASSCCTLASR